MSAVALPGLTLAGEPRAQLLPASVRAREKARGTRRILGFFVVIAILVAGAGTAWAYLTQAAAQTALEQANAQTAELLAQQTQYAEATRLAQLVTLTEQAQLTTTSTEVQWLPLLGELATYVPEGVGIGGGTFEIAAPWEPALVAEGPLRPARSAVVTLQFLSADYGLVTDFVRDIPTMYGFADVKIDVTAFDEATLLYVTTVVVTLDADAISQRFAAEDATATDATAPTEDAATEESSTTEGSAG